MKRAIRKLEICPLQGRFAILDSALAALQRALPTFRGADGSHEGIAFLCGRELPDVTLYTAAVVPESDHRTGYVRCSEEQVAAVSKIARRYGLGLLAQVHSHPTGLTMHSEGDDRMVLMPFEGMLSIVVPHYAHFDLMPLAGLGIHQFQDGRWVLARAESVAAQFQVMPTAIDLR